MAIQVMHTYTSPKTADYEMATPSDATDYILFHIKKILHLFSVLHILVVTHASSSEGTVMSPTELIRGSDAGERVPPGRQRRPQWTNYGGGPHGGCHTPPH